MLKDGEKPLDKIVDDGGFTAIFRTIAVVGDSLSSGEFEGTREDGNKSYHDMFEYSWGQFIARACGSKVYNFSRGGMTAREYCEGWGEDNGVWDESKKAQAYIIALGVNDYFNQHQELGSVADIDLNDWRNNKKTIVGYYATIIQRYKEIQPDAKFFFMTMPKSANEAQNKITEEFLALLNKMTEIFSNSYVIDLYNYAPVYDASFREKFFLGGHMNACGYILTAKMVASHIDYIIRHNMEDFKQIGFVGTPYKYR
jgi:lysophospholipase L1-like esterase